MAVYLGRATLSRLFEPRRYRLSDLNHGVGCDLLSLCEGHAPDLCDGGCSGYSRRAVSRVRFGVIRYGQLLRCADRLDGGFALVAAPAAILTASGNILSLTSETGSSAYRVFVAEMPRNALTLGGSWFGGVSQ